MLAQDGGVAMAWRAGCRVANMDFLFNFIYLVDHPKTTLQIVNRKG
jgi:aspartate oxidase